MSTPRKIPRPRNSPLHDQRRANRIMDKFVFAGVHDVKDRDLSPTQKVERLQRVGVVERTPHGLKLTKWVKQYWLEERGSNRMWNELTPAKQKKWADHYIAWFDKHQTKLLEKLPARVKTARSYFSYRAEQTRQYTNQLVDYLNDISHRSEEYETIFNQCIRMKRLASIFDGIAEQAQQRQRDSEHRPDSPHSL